MKLFNDQSNAQVFKFIRLFISALHVSGLSFSSSLEAGVQYRHWFKSAGYGVSAWGADVFLNTTFLYQRDPASLLAGKCRQVTSFSLATSSIRKRSTSDLWWTKRH
jgi:hypothetical protein